MISRQLCATIIEVYGLRGLILEQNSFSLSSRTAVGIFRGLVTHKMSDDGHVPVIDMLHDIR